MKKVLIIEDNLNILENASEILELSNYRVFTAQNGKTGIEIAILNKPDLILCDIMMPELDGYGVLHVIQKNPQLQNIPFIFLTAKTDLHEIRKGMSLGADDYLTKPFDADELLEAIEGRIKKAALRDHSNSSEPQPIRTQKPAEVEKMLSDFVEGRQVDKYKKKQRIYSEGNHPIKLFYVKKGAVKVFKRNDDGKELIVKIINEGQFFGYTALLEKTCYKESVDAIEDSEIANIPLDEFEDLIYSTPGVTRRFIKLLANDITEKEEQLLHLAYNSLRRKVAASLLMVAKSYKKSEDKNVITLTRETLAALAGTAIESLIRTLTDFKAEKLIEIRDGKITIPDLKRLE